MKALEVAQKLTPEVLERIENAVQNKPKPAKVYRR
jgi:hypothetical protein